MAREDLEEARQNRQNGTENATEASGKFPASLGEDAGQTNTNELYKVPEVTLPPITYRNLDLPLDESLQRYLNSANYKLVTAYLLYGERYLKSEKFTESQIRAAPYLSKDYTII